MARIKVTGYINTDDVDDDLIDLEHPTGLSEDGLMQLSDEIELDDMTFTLQR